VPYDLTQAMVISFSNYFTYKNKRFKGNALKLINIERISKTSTRLIGNVNDHLAV